MSEMFAGVTFPWQPVTPLDDAIIRRAILADSILSGCELSYSGSTLTMASGLMIACGRQFRHTATQNWAVVDATSGYARLLLTIDTTRASTEESFDQIVDSIEYASALDGFSELQQTDINRAGTIYQIPVCIVSLGTGGITGIVTQIGGNVVTVELPVSGWSSLQQTVHIPGVSADYPVMVFADDSDSENAEAYHSAVVKGIRKTNGYLTFGCESVPDRDLTTKVALRV